MTATTDDPRPLPLKEQAYQQLLGLLMSGELTPESPWSERQLAARLGMSKTPIRVALERLDRDGFVEILPQRGVRLRELTEPEAVDHYDFRIALEGWNVRRAAANVTAGELRELRRLVARQRKLLERRLTAEKVTTMYFELDSAFHFSLAEIGGNGEIIRAMQTQRDKLWRVISTLLQRDPEWIATTIDEHEAIVDAIERGDADGAAREMTHHLERGKQFLRDALAAAA